MGHLEAAKNLLTSGNKEGAIKLLVSILQTNRTDVDVWLLLAEIIDEPDKKKDCYNQVLRFSPNNSPALEGLRKLEAPAPQNVVITHSIEQIQDLRTSYQHNPSSKPVSPVNNTKNDLKMTVLGLTQDAFERKVT